MGISVGATRQYYYVTSLLLCNIRYEPVTRLYGVARYLANLASYRRVSIRHSEHPLSSLQHNM